jgi:hypothetical protein
VDGCARAVSVGGADEQLVEHVDFLVGAAPQRVSQPPFLHTLAGPAATQRVRAVAVLRDGRRVTLDASARVCA